MKNEGENEGNKEKMADGKGKIAIDEENYRYVVCYATYSFNSNDKR